MAIRILSNALLTYNDRNYREAVNCKGTLYHDPITITFDGRKYLLGPGSKDDITLFKEGHRIYIMAVNRPLSYISLEMIDLDKWMHYDVVDFNSHQLQTDEWLPKNLLDISVRRQLKAIRQYEE